MANVQATRVNPLDSNIFAGAGIEIAPAPTAFRSSLRAKPNVVASLSKALGVNLPKSPKTSETTGSRTAMWLGPDEWLIVDTKVDPNSDLAKTKALHSAVDVSHRNTAIIVSGANAADAISAGCPQDLSSDVFPVGACSRTVLGKVEVVIHRVKPTVFRVECWRSFSGYAFDFLATAAKDV